MFSRMQQDPMITLGTKFNHGHSEQSIAASIGARHVYVILLMMYNHV